MVFAFELVENIVERGENAGYQNPVTLGTLKLKSMWEAVKLHFVNKTKF